MADPQLPPSGTSGTIDACIHHTWGDVVELLEYLEHSWRGYVGVPRSLPRNAGMREWVPRGRYPNPFGDHLPAAKAGAPAPASSAEALADEHLEPNGIRRALLLFDRQMFVPGNPNPYLATALVRAINDWNLDRWLNRDERLYGVALVPSQTPELAACEIARVGPHPKIAGVLLAAPVLGKSLGHPVYEPIYRAAVEHDLPIVLHRGGDELLDIPAGPAGGWPMTFAEYWCLAPLALVTQLLSLIANGMLDKYSKLRFYIVGAGICWIPAFVSRFDLIARALRREVPWVRRSATDYLEQVRTSTYGIELGGSDGDTGDTSDNHGNEIVARIIDANPRLADWTIYGSGFPSWDAVSAAQVTRLFGDETSARILRDGAFEWFRWPQ